MAKTKNETTIEGLRGELASRRERVAECKKKLDDARERLQAELDRVLARAQAELDRAQAEVDQYVALIADSLGLPNPIAREARRLETLRLKRLARELLSAGKTPVEVVAELEAGGADPAALRVIVDKLVMKLRPPAADQSGGDEGDAEVVPPGKTLHLPPEAGQKGWKRNRVRELFLDGMAKVEIADELDISVESVSTHISQLRSQGLLPPVGSPPSTGNKSSPEAPEASEEADEDDESEGDSLQDLRDEVSRQQQGHRTRAARIPMTEISDHAHVAVLDRMGDGVTEPDKSGHQHKVYRYVVGGTAGHRHGLLAKAA